LLIRSILSIFFLLLISRLEILSQALRLFQEISESNATRVMEPSEKIVLGKLPELLEGVKHLTKAAIQVTMMW
jgi:hypothetical protein